MIWFWVAVGIFVASLLCFSLTTDAGNDAWFGLNIFVTILSLMAALFLGLSHFIPSPNDPPAPAGPHCAVQQWQQVQVGKVFEKEWVCIAWER